MATLTAAGFVYRAVDRGSFSNLQDGRAYESWVEWQLGRVHGIEAVALAGTLAPSNFNTQPWLIRVYDNTIDLFFNHHSYTALLDPFNRVALMGLGACIENMVVGARGLGHPASVTLFPNGPADDTVARLSLGSAPPEKTPHFHAIARRHTNRGAYDTHRLPPPEAIAALQSLSPGGPVRLDLFAADTKKSQYFAEGTTLAAQAAMNEPAMLAEQFRWCRQTLDQIQATMDGISFIATGLTDLQVRTAMALPELGEDDYARFALDQIANVQMPNTPLFGTITVKDITDPVQLVEAGRLLQRLHLEATTRGLGFQPISQLNWMADREEARGTTGEFRRRTAALAHGPGTMAIGLRVGHALRPARASARRSLTYVLLPRVGSLHTPLPLR